MPRRRSGRHCLAWVLVVLGTFPASALQAQAATLSRWTITGAFSAIRVGDQNDWGYGPELGIRRDFGRPWGITLHLAAPAFGSEGGAVAADLGPTVTYVTRGAEAGLSAGVTALLAGDESELIGGGLGFFVRGHITAWLTRGVGLVAAATLRHALDNGAYPSLSGGIAVRF